MKIAVVGASGLIGAKLVDHLRRNGREVVAASPCSGVNTLTGEGLADALAGAQVVVDVTNSPSFEDTAVMDFFTTSACNLIAAEKVAGLGHHIVLAIVGADGLKDSGYMRAKVAQEDIVRASGIPFTIVRSTQFFEFVEGLAMADGKSEVRLSPALMQPIASDDVVAILADVVESPPLNGTLEIAGPEPISFSELARETLSAHEDPRRVIADPTALYFGAMLNDRSLIPDAGARLGLKRFGEWLRQSIPAD